MRNAIDENSRAIVFEDVNIVFGDDPQSALAMMDEGRTRAEIQAETDQVLGVHACSLEVREAEILVLMGLSGSGKSTLLRAVNGLNPVCRGRVLVHDGSEMADVTNAGSKKLRQMRLNRVSMVFQQFGLLPWRNVIDNVGLGLELSGMSKKEREEKVRKQLDLVNLGDWADRKVGELSGGMQQRVGLARAFATEAPILLMDEPFSALDPLIRTRLQDELLALQRNLRRTILFVSHDLDEAFKLGDRIAIMEGGRIVQCGTPSDIIHNPVNDYVSDFVAHTNLLEILRARDVMSEDDGTPPSEGGSVAPDTPVREFMDRLGQGATVKVEADGKTVGLVRSKDLVSAVAPKARAERAPNAGAEVA